VEIVASEMMMLGDRRESNHPQSGETVEAIDETEEDFPF
jgi:hypothetical protein